MAPLAKLNDRESQIGPIMPSQYPKRAPSTVGNPVKAVINTALIRPMPPEIYDPMTAGYREMLEHYLKLFGGIGALDQKDC